MFVFYFWPFGLNLTGYFWRRELQPEYAKQLEVALHFTDPKEWCTIFNNWEHMQLREDLVLSKDFYMLNLTTWTKLKIACAGGPEIPFFQYQKDVTV
jgi:hypothetical protein